MKVLLINPNYPTFFRNEKNGILFYNRPLQPLSLAIIASMLEEKNFKVKIVDANLRKIPIEKLKEKALEFNPEIVLVTSSPIDRWQCPTPDYSPAVETVDAVREILPNSFIILTGAHGTSFPEEVLLNCKNANVLIRGEPEETVSELIDKFSSPNSNNENWKTVSGISYIEDNNKIISTPERNFIENLDKLPLPAYHLLEMDRYYNDFLFNIKNFSIVETSRGCPFSCIFCYKKMLGYKFRTKSVERTLEELDLLYNKFKVRAIYFIDLTFTLDLERVGKICKGIIEKGYKITWGCTTRADRVNEKILKLMKKAGCKFITYGVETFDSESLKKIKKGISPEKIKVAVKMTKDFGIEADLNFVIGLPGDNEKKVEKDWKIYTSLNPYSIGASIALPYPDTPLYNMAKKEGVIKNNGWNALSDFSGLIGTSYTQKKLKKILIKHTIRARAWYFRREFGRFFYFHLGFIMWFLNLLKRSSLKEILEIFNFGIRNIKEIF